MAELPDGLRRALADRYRLDRELGRGGMATVYLAHDLKHDRPVALKVMHPALAYTLGPERFLREIRVTARLDHPHILPVLDSGEAAGLLWYTMPYIEGESLRERLRREVQLPVDEAVRLACEVADALQCAHEHGVIHRDIKPENVLLSSGHARVADFGLARALTSANQDQLSETGLAVGTPAYMSPEQAAGGHIDARTDVYALGVMLYEMLAGEPPYTGPTAQAVLAKRAVEPVPHVCTLRESVPEALEQAVTRALAKVPGDRFTSAAEFAGALATPPDRGGGAWLSAHFALRDLGADHSSRTEMEEMIKAAYRAAGVTQQLLAYSRQQVLWPAVLDVNEVIGELASTLERLIGSDRRLVVRPAPAEVRVWADRGQVEQVLINLVANARDATGTDGLIRVETEAVELDRATLDPSVVGEPDPGAFVRIAVRDDGIGMAPGVAAQAFEPFFTTKPPGKGTGLGLSMVYGIVKQSGGYVKIDSAPGGGTTVEVYLPRVVEEVSDPEDAPATAHGHGERVLVVEDEPAVRAIVRRLLQGYGYVVHEAPAGRAAFEFMAGHPGEVDLVLTDVVMPTMTGRELADRLREQYPTVPVLFMSGYSGEDIRQRGLMLAGAPFVRKPFTPEGLSAAVRELLDRTRRTMGRD